MGLQCITVLVSLLYTSSPEHLETSLKDVPFSSFIKSLLHDEDLDAMAAGIVFSQLLLHKIPDVFVPAFAKEGTYVALQKLAANAPQPPKLKLQVRLRSISCAAMNRILHGSTKPMIMISKLTVTHAGSYTVDGKGITSSTS